MKPIHLKIMLLFVLYIFIYGLVLSILFASAHAYYKKRSIFIDDNLFNVMAQGDTNSYGIYAISETSVGIYLDVATFKKSDTYWDRYDEDIRIVFEDTSIAMTFGEFKNKLLDKK